MRNFDNLEQPYFIGMLEYLSKGGDRPRGSDFFIESVKYLIDALEFGEWLNGPAEQTLSISEVLSVCPFRKLWIEFYDFKDPKGCKGYFMGEEKIKVFGIGYDLDLKQIHWATEIEDPIEKLLTVEIKSLDMPGRGLPIDSKISHLYRMFLLTTKYIQTEHVQALQKTIRYRKSEFKKGKIKRYISKYAVIYRKQPNTKTKISGSSSPEPYDWQCRWKVRGHWRRIKGIGHDYQGKEIDGFTWVKEHERGPEGKPLIDRPRILKNKLPPNFIEMPEISHVH